MSLQNNDTKPQQDPRLFADERFGKILVQWHHIDEAGRTAPAEMLQDYRTFLEQGSDPNLMILGYHVPSTTQEHEFLSSGTPTMVLAHRLLYTDLTGYFLEWRRSHVRESSQGESPSERTQPEAVSSVVRHSAGQDQILHHISHPLSAAACNMDRKRVALLKEYGANFKDHFSKLLDELSMLMKNPFLPAVRALDESLVCTLIELATPSHNLTLQWATQCLVELVEATIYCSAAGLRIADVLLQYGASTDCIRFLGDRAPAYMRFWLEYPIAFGDPNRTSLQIVSGEIDAKGVQRLIDGGHDVNDRDVLGMSPLLEAVYYGHAEAVRILLLHGANTQQRAGEQVCTIMESVLEGKHYPASKLAYNRRLFDAASFVRGRWSALHIAAQRGFSTIAKLLLMDGADVAAREQTGRTALDIAVQCSHLDTAFVLLCVTSSFKGHLDNGRRLMASAIEGRNLGAIKILMDHGVSFIVDQAMQEATRAQIDEDPAMAPMTMPRAPISSFWMTEDGLFISQIFLCWKCLPTLPENGSRKLSQLQQLDQTQFCRFCQLVDDCKPAHCTGESRVGWFYDSPPMSGCHLIVDINDSWVQHEVQRMSDDWHTTFQSLEPLENQDTGSPAAILLAKRWIENCTNTYAQCNRQSMERYFPTRVVKILSDSLKIVEETTICAPYVALSHRWGSESLPQTLSTNIRRRKEILTLSELTQTMQDAVEITRRVGYQYIWIDALCIIQDSEEDWLQESAKMSEVFSGATVTIAVADAENHSEGMIRPRTAKCMRPFAVPFLELKPYHKRVDYEGEGEFYVFPNTPRVSAGPRKKGTLDTRGWILQEQMLSRRILYFGRGEIFWDCNTISASESSPISTYLLQEENPDETWSLRTIRRTLSGSTDASIIEEKLADVWIQLIKNYSSRDLTHQRDKLVALQGILRPLSRILHQEPVAGMWRTQLWRQLLWWIPNRLSLDASSSQLLVLAPTWSWLCASGPVAYHNSLATRRKMNGIKEREVINGDFTDLESQMIIKSIDVKTLPDGRGVAGSMTISALSFPYHLTVNDMKKPAVKRFNGSKWKLNAGSWLLDRQAQLPLDLHCIVIAEDIVAKMLVCLCVVRSEESDEWCRIGLCHWDGLTWQISKYAGKVPEERTFTIV